MNEVQEIPEVDFASSMVVCPFDVAPEQQPAVDDLNAPRNVSVRETA